MVIAMAAVVCVADDWVAVAAYCRAKEARRAVFLPSFGSLQRRAVGPRSGGSAGFSSRRSRASRVVALAFWPSTPSGPALVGSAPELVAYDGGLCGPQPHCERGAGRLPFQMCQGRQPSLRCAVFGLARKPSLRVDCGPDCWRDRGEATRRVADILGSRAGGIVQVALTAPFPARFHRSTDDCRGSPSAFAAMMMTKFGG